MELESWRINMKVRDKYRTGGSGGCGEAFMGSLSNLGALICPIHNIKQLPLYKGKESRSECCMKVT